jgi:hypothetical protein
MPLKGEFGSLQIFFTATCLASMQALRSRRVFSALKHLGASDQGGQTGPRGRLDRPGQTD